jgi:ribosomal protein S18 acetylase RimI-like enzyme
MSGADAADVARLRVAAADGGLLARLGTGPVRRFMELAVRDPDTFGAVADDDGRVVGFILCTTASVSLQRRALRSSPGLWLRLPLLLVRDPRLVSLGVGRLRALFRRRRPPTATDEPALRLFDISVAPQVRGQGVGRALLAAALAEAGRRGHREMGLTVLADNNPALRLYETAGFIRGRAGTRDDGRPYVTMRRTLESAASTSS